MPRDAIGNEISPGSFVRLTYQVIKIDEHEDDTDADLHLQPVTRGGAVRTDADPIEVHASTVISESGPPDDWAPPEGTDVGEARVKLPASAGDANDPYRVREEPGRLAPREPRPRAGHKDKGVVSDPDARGHKDKVEPGPAHPQHKGK